MWSPNTAHSAFALFFYLHHCRLRSHHHILLSNEYELVKSWKTWTKFLFTAIKKFASLDRLATFVAVISQTVSNMFGTEGMPKNPPPHPLTSYLPLYLFSQCFFGSIWQSIGHDQFCTWLPHHCGPKLSCSSQLPIHYKEIHNRDWSNNHTLGFMQKPSGSWHFHKRKKEIVFLFLMLPFITENNSLFLLNRD